MNNSIVWPEEKQSAFTVFDDTDCSTLGNVGEVYSLLTDCGLLSASKPRSTTEPAQRDGKLPRKESRNEIKKRQ